MLRGLRSASVVIALALPVAAAGPVAAQESATFVGQAWVDGAIVSGTNGRVELTFDSWSDETLRNRLLGLLLQEGDAAVAAELGAVEPVGQIRFGSSSSYPLVYGHQYVRGEHRVVFAIVHGALEVFDASRSRRSLDHDLSVIEIRLSEGEAGAGMLIPGAELVVDMPNRTLAVEDYSSAQVRLVNVFEQAR